MTDQSPDLTRFLACWPYTLAQEDVYPQDWTNPANFSDDPYDPGGATMDGIIQAEYNSYCSQHGLPQQSVRNITQAQGQDIYFNNFWLPHCPLVPVGLDLELFDANFRKKLKKSGFLTRDSRAKERRKYGLKKARKAPQWNKR